MKLRRVWHHCHQNTTFARNREDIFRDDRRGRYHRAVTEYVRMENLVEVIIVGGGPAGLGAALALCRQNHRSVVIDSGEYRNRFATEMHMVST